MKVICKILDSDFNLKANTMHNPQKRLASRGIVVRSDGRIALFHKSNMNEYKLPGGGIENDETKEETFVREVFEETGCKIKIIKELGVCEEHKSRDNFVQKSYVFVGRVIDYNKNLHLTDKEQKEGGQLLWLYPEEALKLIYKCFDNLLPSPVDEKESLYSTRFIVLRDQKILEYYIKNKMEVL